MPRLISDNPLSPRERSVMVLVVRGLSNKMIGAKLGITEKAAQRRLQRACQRIGAANRTEAAIMAVRKGWIDLRLPGDGQGQASPVRGSRNEVVN